MDKKTIQEERGQKNNDTPIYLTSDSTLQTPEEHNHDQREDPTKDTTMEVSNDDLQETETDRIRGEMLDGGGNSADQDQ